jgi:folate-binding protein YgfZ
MNIDWINFLKSNNATFIEKSAINFPENQQSTTNNIIAIAHLGIIKVTGKDAAHFLQGQITCNVNELSESNSFFTAFCNAKGRTVSTLLIIKTANVFLLILPEELLEKVMNKLRMYILRSDVQLHDSSHELCLIGVSTTNSGLLASFPNTDFNVTNNTEIIVKFPSHNYRYLIISSMPQMSTLWNQFTQNHNLSVSNSDGWVYQDISAGIPWLSEATSEQYIPQMLNIDKLGGISFTKGCYTGQEIIARTHYLGKAKRELFLAECDITAMLNIDDQIFSDENKQSLGKVLSFQVYGQQIRLLVVMSSNSSELRNLVLNNSNQEKIYMLDFQ